MKPFSTSDFYRAQQVSPVPLEVAEAAARDRPRPTRQQVAAAQAEELRRQLEARDGVRTFQLEGDLNAALRGDAIETRDPFDQRLVIDPTKGHLTGDELQASFGYTAPAAAGLTPEQQFKEAERAEQERVAAEGIRERFQTALAAKEQVR